MSAEHVHHERGPRRAGPAPFASSIETHTGAVFFLGERAFKVKKPVRYGFLDFTTIEARRAACRREVELNARLAPDVYLGVGELRGPDGAPWEPFVAMRRLDAASALSQLAASGRELGAEVGRLAEVLARFHAAAARVAVRDQLAGAESVLGRWRANAAEMAPLLGALFDPTVAAGNLERASRYLEGRHLLFSARIAAGRACDGHGDLLADDVFLLEDGPRVLDCLEFDDDLRYGDALGDVCSLAMDLERLGRGDLATSLLAAYGRASGDRWPPSLAHHYVAYRAQVRALVAGLRFAQGDEGSAALARRLLALCAAHLEAGRIRLVVVGGLPGTGKTTVAGWVADRLAATVVRSDIVRKELAGLDPARPRPAGFGLDLYAPERTEATYRAMLERARAELAMGASVVLDASFSDPAWRAAARHLAAEASADLDELRCIAPAEVAESRLASRAAAGGDASDADASVARAMAERSAPWPDAAVLDTDAAPGQVHARLDELLGRH